MRKLARIAILLFIFLPYFAVSSAFAKTQGIYLTQYTLENTAYLHYLIKHSVEAGINTFVVDLERPSKRYQENIAQLKSSGIKYVARIVIFPGGGTREQVANPTFWQRQFRLVKQAIDLGASEIQLDYIRYYTKQPASAQNAKDIYQIISWYKNKISGHGIPLQADVFGIATFGEARNIGQNIKLFSQTLDAVCPMVYPSHYEPARAHFNAPYDTIYDSLLSLKDQFPNNNVPIRVIAWIELSNYRFPMSRQQTLTYIAEQIEAVHDAGVAGWYAWSAHNRYDNLFNLLKSNR